MLEPIPLKQNEFVSWDEMTFPTECSKPPSRFKVRYQRRNLKCIAKHQPRHRYRLLVVGINQDMINKNLKHELNQHLVGGFNPSEKYQSVGMIILNIWKNKTCSTPPTRHRDYNGAYTGENGHVPSIMWINMDQPAIWMRNRDDETSNVCVLTKPRDPILYGLNHVECCHYQTYRDIVENPSWIGDWLSIQWEFQDPQTEVVLYHI